VLCICLTQILSAQTPAGEELLGLYSVPTTELGNVAAPIIGSLLYNPTDKNVYVYTATGWSPIDNSGPTVYTGYFIISGEGAVTVKDIPFHPSQVTFNANANVESLNIDSDNGTGNNDRGIDNSFGTMNGFVRDIGGTLTQQVMFIGGHGNSINNISRYASSSNCIGIRYGDQNGNSLGKIEGAFNSFTTDGFIINVNYTDGVITVNNANVLIDVQPDDVDNEALLVLFTAYK